MEKKPEISMENLAREIQILDLNRTISNEERFSKILEKHQIGSKILYYLIL